MTVEAMVDEVLRPLLQADGGDVTLVSVEGSKVVLRVSGTAAYGAGAKLVHTEVLHEAIRRVLPGAEVVVETEVPRARRRSDPK
ncbi:MAG: NifU family protein [Myxococcota bacterium]